MPIDERNKTVGVDNIKPLAHSVIELKRDLVLMPLFAPDLAKWGIRRADLIDTTAKIEICNTAVRHLITTGIQAVHNDLQELRGSSD